VLNNKSKCKAMLYFCGVCLAVFQLLFPFPSRSQSTSSDPIQVVRAWYRAFGNASGSKAQYNGTVGDLSSPFPQAYRLLSPVLQGRMSEQAFEQTYAQVAHMALLQAHLASVDKNTGLADVFVEEERTIVLERTNTSPGIPAIAWYEGTLHLTKLSGAWQIAAFDLGPEDIISMEHGGHEPWLADPDEVAKVAAGQFCQYGRINCGRPCSSAVPRLKSGIAEVYICADRRYRERLVKLHSGEWRAISSDPRPTTPVSK
jgi:hypothetical protein